jgi:hypothetical protein
MISKTVNWSRSFSSIDRLKESSLLNNAEDKRTFDEIVFTGITEAAYTQSMMGLPSLSVNLPMMISKTSRGVS